ncbi:hypothetical protein [Actinomadura verrucosospora]|uniref:Uncharacterized protein n=1 Tax=Actinomadura verrucosospora TaxID=46165 RepID=A0A7D3VVJ1_ACTVE|nr:hypothetical protein [Actinomadura verrucosospora]QKG23650.1 hypothetical protein ACTIVE_5293 [Actinomadura verrucosospora]
MKASTYVILRDMTGKDQQGIETEAAGYAAPAFGPDTDPATLWPEFPEGLIYAPEVNADEPFFATIVKIWPRKPADV